MIQIFLISILILAPIARGAVRIWAYAPIQILTLLVAFFYVVKIFSEREIVIKRTALDIPILSFLFIFIITFFNSSYMYAGITEFMRLVSLAAIFYIVVNFVKREGHIRRLLDTVLTAATAIALFGILQYLGVIDNSWWANPKFLSATYVNHNHFAGLMEFSIPLCVGMILLEKEIGKRSLYVYSFLALCVAFLFSMSRGGWLSLTIAMIFMFAAIFRKGKAGFALFMLILLLAALALFMVNSTHIDLWFKRVHSYGELDFSGRALIWKGTLGIIKDNWLLGTGPGTFIYNFPRYRPAGLNRFANFAHNDYLQVFSEMGVFGVALMILIIGFIIRKGLRTYRIARTPLKRWISLSLSTAILSIAIHGMGDFNFYIPANAILFAVFCGLIFAISSKREKDYAPLILKPRPVLYGFFKSIAFICVLACIIFITSGLAAEVYLKVSGNALSQNDLERAERSAFSATRLCPINYVYPYRLAEIYYKKGDMKQSEKNYKEALRLNPMDAWSWIGLADAYYGLYKASPLDQGLCESAVSAYRKALELDPLNSYYLKKFAAFLLNTGDPHLSSQMYRKASYIMTSCEVPPVLVASFSDGESYLEAGDLAFSAQDYNKALVFYRMAEAFLEPKEPAQLGQTRCYIKLRSISKSFNKFKEIRPSIEAKSALFAALSDYYLKNGFIGTAERFGEKSVASNPKNPEAYNARYKFLRSLKREDYPAETISKILSFNKLPLSFDLGAAAFNLEFEVKKGLASEGRLGVDVIVPAGMYEFKVKARGEKAQGIWPHMEVRFNDKKSIDSYVSNKHLGFYQGIIVVDYPVNRFDIIYDNDYYDAESMEDRNLYVESITLRALP